MSGVGEFLVAEAHKRGMYMFVDTDGLLKYYPPRLMTKGFLDLINRNYDKVLNFIVTEAVTTE